jgi:ribosome maturation factor RimP
MEQTRKKIKETVESLGYYLYDITFEKEGNDTILRVMIDHEKYIQIDDCVTVSRAISEWLDQEDPIKEAYLLEVTTGGAERELRTDDEIKRAVGKFVYIETVEQKLEGDLQSFKDHVLTVKHKNKRVSKINTMDVEFIRLAIQF